MNKQIQITKDKMPSRSSQLLEEINKKRATTLPYQMT